MLISGNYGYYRFYPASPEENTEFQREFGALLDIGYDGVLTFAATAKLPHYAVQGLLYGGAGLAIKSWADTPEAIMQALDLRYDLGAQKVVNKTVVNLSAKINILTGADNIPYSTVFPICGAMVGTQELVSFSGSLDIRRRIFYFGKARLE